MLGDVGGMRSVMIWSPIYDIKSHLRVLPLQLSQQALDQWQQGDEIFTGSPQTPKFDRVQYLPDDFRSYLEAFDEYSFEHLDLPYEDEKRGTIGRP
jgi:hypothetical protein